MKTGPLVALVIEARNVVRAMQEERKVTSVGPVVVSGMLAEQLARELGAGAGPGAVVVRNDPVPGNAQVLVRMIAGDPSQEDEALVRAAEDAVVPVVLVQLWPQEQWRQPYVLSPFVVECKTGQGFPIRDIADRIATAVDNPIPLAARVPVLKDVVEAKSEFGAVMRSALVGVTVARKGPARPILALEQVGTISRMRALENPEPQAEQQLPVLAATAAATIAASYGFREVARLARRRLPARVVDTAVAAAGTWVLAEAARRLEKARS